MAPVLHAALSAVLYADTGFHGAPFSAISNQSTVAACIEAHLLVRFRTLLGAVTPNVRLALAPVFIMHLAILEWVVAVHFEFAPPLGVVVLAAYFVRLTHASVEAGRRIAVAVATRVDGIAPGAARQLGLLSANARRAFATPSNQHQH
jgi:hypothetical protein